MRFRNYRREYNQYYGNPYAKRITPLQRVHRKHKYNRNRARTKARRTNGDASIKGKDIDHKNGNPLDNRPRNLRVMPRRLNRSKDNWQKPARRRAHLYTSKFLRRLK